MEIFEGEELFINASSLRMESREYWGRGGVGGGGREVLLVVYKV